MSLWLREVRSIAENGKQANDQYEPWQDDMGNWWFYSMVGEQPHGPFPTKVKAFEAITLFIDTANHD